MKTPIADFVSDYVGKNPSRFHTPGHKGTAFLGCEPYDLTEIDGADVLSSADGIIAESERNAASLFGTGHTFYSAEGSTPLIKTMLALVTAGKKNPKILAARGAHKALVYAAALLDIEVIWIYPDDAKHICSAQVSGENIEAALADGCDFCALYLTSPDYLGGTADIARAAELCHERGIPLIVDNAHGAYLNFLSPSRHPIALGADMCCDSAHKTLPVLTGGAYLHISKNTNPAYAESARRMLSVFTSTSPSYLILQSLDLCNRYIENGYSERLARTVRAAELLRGGLRAAGYTVLDTEPLKIVINANKYGYRGDEIAAYLNGRGVVAEFYDSEYLVFMLNTENSDSDLNRLESALLSLAKRADISEPPAPIVRSKPGISIREAVFSPRETVSVRESVGRICATPGISCPPAVPIVVSGEVISEGAARLFEKYNIDKIEVVKND